MRPVCATATDEGSIRESQGRVQRAQSLEDELTEKAQTLREVKEEYGRAKEFWETVRMKTELDGLKQLE